MNTFVEKMVFSLTFAVFFLTMVAVLVAVGYATIQLAGDVATKDDIAKIDERLNRIESLLSDMRKESSESMTSHLSTAHVGSSP